MDLSFYAQAHLDTKAEKVCAILQKIQPGEIVSLLFSHCKHRFSQTCLLVGDLPIFLAMYFIPLCSTLLFFHVMSPELCLRFLCQAEEAIHQASAIPVILSVMSLLRRAISEGSANGPHRKLHSVFLKSP